jgi:transposase-like protein
MRETVTCPYCGEPNLIAVDEQGGSIQRYVEDCQVCCHPWEVTVRVGAEVDVELKTLDE